MDEYKDVFFVVLSAIVLLVVVFGVGVLVQYLWGLDWWLVPALVFGMALAVMFAAGLDPGNDVS